MASDVASCDQAVGQGDAGLAQMFLAGESAIGRRRTDNIFKQLDERSLTEEEEAIIQQRVQLQRQLLQEYEKREQKRKVAELQDMWPDLSEAAAVRALELCSGKEEEAVLRLTEEPAFKRRVLAETGTFTPTTIVLPAAKSRSSRGSSGSRGSSSRVIPPGQLNGNVFVGRFRSKLGPYQSSGQRGGSSSAAAAAAAAAPAPAAAKRRGQKRRSAPAAAAGAEEDLGRATSAAAAATASDDAAASAAEAAPAAVLPPAAERAASASPRTRSKRQRSSSPSSDEHEACETGGCGAAAAAAASTSDGADTDPPLPQQQQQEQEQEQEQQETAAAADRVTGMMARQVARLAPLLAAGRLLEFEGRRPGAAAAVLEVLAAEHGDKVAGPISTAWEVLLEEQRWKEGEGLAAAVEASKVTAGSSRAAMPQPAAAAEAEAAPAGPEAAAGDAASSRQAQQAEAAAALAQALPAGGSQEQPGQQQQRQQPRQQLPRQLLHLPRRQPMPAQEQPALQQPQTAGGQASADEAGPAAAADSDASTVTEPAAVEEAGQATAADATSALPAAAAASSGGEAEAAGAAPGTTRRGGARRAAAVAAAAVSAAAAAEERRGSRGSSRSGAAGRGGGGGGRAARAISETGHTCRGRVRQKSHKACELLEVGELVARPEWHNAGYIFPAGFKSRLLFRSSVDLDALCLHECEIVGQGGAFWPAPTFMVTARDRQEEPIVAKSCTGCWSGILKRINAVITQRIAAGEDLPPPPRTAIAGPEYFGLNDAATQAAIEALDPDHLCATYWEGKQQRALAAAGMPVPVQPLPPRAPSSGAGSSSGASGGRKRGRRAAGAEADADDEGDEDGEGYRGNHWSSISRRERYLKRCTEAGDAAPVSADDSLLPGVLDPITLEPVVNPAISPAGHVMGLATWKAVLSESGRCPFTKAPLRGDMLTVLTANNIERFRERIITP